MLVLSFLVLIGCDEVDMADAMIPDYCLWSDGSSAADSESMVALALVGVYFGLTG